MSRNFGKGLKPYSKLQILTPSLECPLSLSLLVKRLFTDELNEKQTTDLPSGQQGLLKKDDWLIDEEEDYPMNPQHP